MKKQKTPPQKNNPLLRILGYIIFTLVILGLLAALIIWVLWPIRHKNLQTADIQHYSFDAAKAKVAKINQAEQAEGVKPECYSKLNIHPQPTAKAVVMFHGISACPFQFSALAQYFYDHGYNVYTPLTPEHGRQDNLNHANVTTQQLVDYVNTSINITDALGAETGVIGLSGGGNLATWASQYRSDVDRLLVLSPFYEPSISQSPKWKIRPLMVLYGNHVLPDELNKPKDPQHALSYYALAQYVTIFYNLPEPFRNSGLKHLAIVMANDDDLIDQPLALKTLSGVAKANRKDLVHYQLPADLKLGHDIISPDNKYVVQHQDFLHQKYFELYEQ